MKVTKDKETTVVEITKRELQEYNLTFEKLDCKSLHTRTAIGKILFDAMGESWSFQKEIHLLPDCRDGCVIVCKKREKLHFDAVSFSLFQKEESEVFSCFFS